MHSEEGAVMIRDMSESDLESVYAIASESLDQYYDPSVFYYFRTAWPAGQLVACDPAGRVIGFLTSSRAEGYSARIMMFAVSGMYRSRGTGSMLLNEFRRRCMMSGVRTMLLEVRTSNAAARRFYRRNGFMETEILNEYYTDGGQGLRMVAPVLLNQ